MIPSILEQLNVTEEVFNAYIATLTLDPIEITYELYSFDTPYNGNVIDNIA
jgi:LPS sulfotransferase NodH